MIIQIIAPHDAGAQISVGDIPIKTESLKIEICDENNRRVEENYDIRRGHAEVSGLENNKKYFVTARAYDKDENIIAESNTRVLIPNYVPGRCVTYLHPYDSTFDPAGRYLGSPSIVKMKNGDIIVSHDLFLESYPNKFGVDFRDKTAYETCVTKLYKSSDNGKTWSFLSDIHSCTFGKLFLFKDKLCMIALSSTDDAVLADPFNLEERRGDSNIKQSGLDIMLFCSEDGGHTFGKPCSITGARTGGFHKAATPVVECDGRLWVAFDTPKNPESGFGMAAASVDINCDITDGKNWVVTEPYLYYDKSWSGTVDGMWPYMMEEANAVVGPDDEVYVIARYNSVNYGAEFIEPSDDGLKVVVMKADKRNPSAPLEFVRMQHFIGGLSKFTVNYDDKSKKYYSLVSRATGNMCCQRNILSLVSSDDLCSWSIERDCINLLDLNWYQSCREAGMYYCDWVFDGNDILAVCRTALHDCTNYHDSNMITFHRFSDFRETNYNFEEV